MKKLAFIAAVVFTTLTLNSCRQSDDVLSPEEFETLKRAQDSSTTLLEGNATVNPEQGDNPASAIDGELLPPPKK